MASHSTQRNPFIRDKATSSTSADSDSHSLSSLEKDKLEKDKWYRLDKHIKKESHPSPTAPGTVKASYASTLAAGPAQPVTPTKTPASGPASPASTPKTGLFAGFSTPSKPTKAVGGVKDRVPKKPIYDENGKLCGDLKGLMVTGLGPSGPSAVAEWFKVVGIAGLFIADCVAMQTYASKKLWWTHHLGAGLASLLYVTVGVSCAMVDPRAGKWGERDARLAKFRMTATNVAFGGVVIFLASKWGLWPTFSMPVAPAGRASKW